MTIDMSSGNFSLKIQGELSETAKADLLAKGLKYELERSVLSKTYVGIAGVMGKRNKLVLPDKFERESVEFNDENAVKFHDAMKAALTSLGNFTISVGKYTKGETSESRKRATGIYEASKAKGQASLDLLAQMCGYDGEMDDVDAFVEKVHAWIMNPLA